VLSVAFLFAWLTRAIAVWEELPDPLFTWDFWTLTAILMLAVVIAAVAPFWLAGRFVKDLYGLSGLRSGIFFILRNRFGQAGFQPWMRIEGGRIAQQTDSVLTRIGGQGSMIICRDNAVVLERKGKFTRTLGPGISRLKVFERIYDVVDLCPKRYVHTVSAMTRDGIPVHWEVEVRYQIANSAHSAPPGAQYPISHDDVFRASTCRWVREARRREDPDMDWEGLVVAYRTDSILRSLLALRPLNELAGFSHNDEKTARESLQSELLTRLQPVVSEFGAQILEIKLGNLQVDDEVTQQWIKAWRARWQNWSADQLAHGEASYVFEHETAKADAQMQMIARVTQELQMLLDQQALSPQAVPQILLIRLFSVLDRADFASASRVFFPTETLDALENVRQSVTLGTVPKAATVTLVADPSNIAVNGQAVLQVSVTDAWGNPVPDGTLVEFTTNLGKVAHSSRHTDNGQATTMFTASDEAGPASVIALSGSAFGRVTVTVA
jgi:hypothetical protein